MRARDITIGHRVAVLLAFMSGLAAVAAPRASAQRGPTQALDEARFLDLCLADAAAADKLYRQALDAGAEGRERGEALFGRARASYQLGHRRVAEGLLEELAAERHDERLGPWGRRGQDALERALRDADPFEETPLGLGEHELRATARPLVEVLLELRKRTGISFVIDPKLPDPWTVSTELGPLPLEGLIGRLLGDEQARRIGNGVYAVGPIAHDGNAWVHRAFGWTAVTRPADRAVAGRARLLRVNLEMPGVHILDVVEQLRQATGIGIELTPAALEHAATVRIWADRVELALALDMVVVPLGLRWRIDGGRIVIDARRGRESE